MSECSERWISSRLFLSFLFTDATATKVSTLSLHDALPISNLITGVLRTRVERPSIEMVETDVGPLRCVFSSECEAGRSEETRLNSSHSQISYAVFCLKKKNTRYQTRDPPLLRGCLHARTQR